MRVRVNGKDMFHYETSLPITSINKKGPVFLVVDPGKTNMACLVGNPFGNIYRIYEFSGSDDFERMYTTGGPEDTSQYCKEFRTFLAKVTEGMDVAIYGIEQAVKYKGQEYYHSQMTLTEIRGNLISLGLDHFGFKPEEINNETWKSAVLPKGFNRIGQKGSYEWLKDKGFARYTHDVTDVVCMYFYLCQKHSGQFKVRCDASEKPLGEYKYTIFPNGIFKANNDYRPFLYNTDFSLKDNLAFYANRMSVNGFCQVPVDSLNVEDIYGHTVGFMTAEASNVTVLVKP